MAIDIADLFQVRSLPPFTLGRQMRPREWDLNGVMKGMERSLSDSLSYHTELRMDLTETPLNVKVDVTGIRDAVMKLVANAADAMPEGGVLSVSTKQAGFDYGISQSTVTDILGKWAVICIQDNGAGMDEKTRERIFEPFFTTKGGVNRGLGLPIAYHIIKEHHGSINVESMFGKGTTVDVYLPLNEKHLKEIEPMPLPASFTSTAGGNGNVHRRRAI